MMSSCPGMVCKVDGIRPSIHWKVNGIFLRLYLLLFRLVYQDQRHLDFKC
jgi:hypothetical protein